MASWEDGSYEDYCRGESNNWSDGGAMDSHGILTYTAYNLGEGIIYNSALSDTISDPSPKDDSPRHDEALTTKPVISSKHNSCSSSDMATEAEAGEATALLTGGNNTPDEDSSASLSALMCGFPCS